MEVTWLGHASFKLKTNNTTIYIDPYQGDYQDTADLILITHDHYDHFSSEKIDLIKGPDTAIVGPSAVTSRLHPSETIAPEQTLKVKDIDIKAVHAYNINKAFHPKNTGVGFILTIEDKKIYFCGDTDHIPEMKDIEADIICIPVGGTYTMNAREAAKAIKTMQPKTAIAIHWGSIVGSRDDADLFKEIVERTTNTKVLILEPGQAVTL